MPVFPRLEFDFYFYFSLFGIDGIGAVTPHAGSGARCRARGRSQGLPEVAETDVVPQRDREREGARIWPGYCGEVSLAALQQLAPWHEAPEPPVAQGSARYRGVVHPRLVASDSGMRSDCSLPLVSRNPRRRPVGGLPGPRPCRDKPGKWCCQARREGVRSRNGLKISAVPCVEGSYKRDPPPPSR